MSFHEVQFPPSISYGSRGGPKFSTSIITVSNGAEQRNVNWSKARASYDASCGVKTQLELHDLITFFRARQGKAYGFRFKDWSDFKSVDPNTATTDIDQVIGTGTGALTTFQLKKNYISGPTTFVRDIKKPVSGTVKISVNNVSQPTGWTVDTTTGIVTFTVAPGNGLLVKAGYEFDVPVRFDTDELSISLDDYNIGSTSVPIVEVRI
jgi:uncharacterized protein (TIGR02217 family)